MADVAAVERAYDDAIQAAENPLFWEEAGDPSDMTRMIVDAIKIRKAEALAKLAAASQ